LAITSTTEELNWSLPRNVERAGAELEICGFQVRRPNHSGMLPPKQQIKKQTTEK